MNDKVNAVTNHTSRNIGALKWWALAAIILSVIAVSMDITILNVALPTLSVTLHASASQLQWFVVSFNLVMGAVLMLGGLLGDLLGRKKMLLVGLTVFGVGSLASAYSTSPGMLIASQAVLGLGAAFIMPLSLSVLPVLYSAKERPKAVAIWAAAAFLALPLGPILGGWLLTNFWWGWIFMVNVPIIVLAIIAVASLLPESRSEYRPKLDPVGILTAGGGLAGFIYGLILAGMNGWGDSGALAFIIAGAVVLAGFVLWERRLNNRPKSQPLVDFGLFHSASFTWGSILAAIGILAQASILFVTPQFFQAVLGTDAIGSGLRLLPMLGGLLLGAILSSQLAARYGGKLIVATGFFLSAVGLFIGATTGITSGFAFIAIWMAIFGLGMGFVLSTATTAALGELSLEKSGVGSALMMMFQKVGGPLGVAIMGSILNSIYRGQLNVAGLPVAAAEAAKGSIFAGITVANKIASETLLNSAKTAFTHGIDMMLWVCGGITIAAMILTLIFLPRRAVTVEQPAEIGKDDLRVPVEIDDEIEHKEKIP